MTLNRHKIDHYVIFAGLKRNQLGKLINRIPGSRLLISNLPYSSVEVVCYTYLLTSRTNFGIQATVWTMNRLFPEEQADLGPHVLLQKHKGDTADDIYPFMPNGISNCYQLDLSISNFRVVG